MEKSRVPCKFWPKCTRDPCRYLHVDPIKECVKYPEICHNGWGCIFNKKGSCKFLHPKQTDDGKDLCKFNKLCANPICWSLHTYTDNGKSPAHQENEKTSSKGRSAKSKPTGKEESKSSLVQLEEAAITMAKTISSQEDRYSRESDDKRKAKDSLADQMGSLSLDN